MKTLQKKYVLLLLLGVCFLFFPLNKAKAAEFGCENTYFGCKNFTADNFGQAADFCVKNYCPDYGQGSPCIPMRTVCPPPSNISYGCIKDGQCSNITVSIFTGYSVAAQQCSDLCAGDKTRVCKPLTEPCPPGPLAGASLDSLKSLAQSTLNKASFSGPTDIINRAIQIMLAFIGSISLALYVYAGLMWMTASGQSDKVEKAKSTMVWTTLGVVMMLLSYILASFIFKSLGL